MYVMTVKRGQNLAKNVPVFNPGQSLSLGNFYTSNGHKKMPPDNAVHVWKENLRINYRLLSGFLIAAEPSSQSRSAV